MPALERRMILNPGFSAGNLAAYNLAGFWCIAFAVFLSASQPFYLSDVIGVDAGHIGQTIGALTIVDELTAIAVAPFLGTLVDWINGQAWKKPGRASGSRVTELAAFAVIGVAFLGYGRVAAHSFPDLYVFRAVFAAGMSGVMSVAVVMLHEANHSDFEWAKLRVWRAAAHVGELRAGEAAGTKNGKLSALLGVCTGLGAVFSVSCFLTLPIRLSSWHPAWSSADSLRATYTILGVAAVCCGGAVYGLGYDCIRQRRQAGQSADSDTPHPSYWRLMVQAVQVSRRNRQLQLAYAGGFVARAATVTSSMFVPLMVYQFYTRNGLCGAQDKPTEAGNCYNAYVFSAILSGVAATVSLVATPVWGVLIDSRRHGCSYTLACAGALGGGGAFLLCFLARGSGPYDPRTVGCFVAVCCMGTAQIGVIISSMSLVSRTGRALEAESHVIGSITGLYSLSGGVGILLVAKIGGAWSDRWVFGPFMVLGAMYGVLLVVASWSRMQEGKYADCEGALSDLSLSRTDSA